MATPRLARLSKELTQLRTQPPPGVSAWLKDDAIDHLEASIVGAAGTPFESGVFKLEIVVPERYPFEPPKLRFLTPIYHPNIDAEGRICLDVLKPAPNGSWKPSWNLSTVLTSIRLLISNANPDDPLVAEIAREYKEDRAAYDKKAREHTLLHAASNAPQPAGTKRPAED